MTYEFQCEACGIVVEKENSIKLGPPPLTDCESCKAEGSMNRLYGLPILMDSTPKTLGSLAERNTSTNKTFVQEDREKNTKRIQTYWEKPTKKQMQNPKKYIEEGV